jgi:hypothetical protein
MGKESWKEKFGPQWLEPQLKVGNVRNVNKCPLWDGFKRQLRVTMAIYERPELWQCEVSHHTELRRGYQPSTSSTHPYRYFYMPCDP